MNLGKAIIGVVLILMSLGVAVFTGGTFLPFTLPFFFYGLKQFGVDPS
jgi:hypothetical protein